MGLLQNKLFEAVGIASLVSGSCLVSRFENDLRIKSVQSIWFRQIWKVNYSIRKAGSLSQQPEMFQTEVSIAFNMEAIAYI